MEIIGIFSALIALPPLAPAIFAVRGLSALLKQTPILFPRLLIKLKEPLSVLLSLKFVTLNANKNFVLLAVAGQPILKAVPKAHKIALGMTASTLNLLG